MPDSWLPGQMQWCRLCLLWELSPHKFHAVVRRAGQLVASWPVAGKLACESCLPAGAGELACVKVHFSQ